MNAVDGVPTVVPSLVQDLWLGRDLRLRGRRQAPFETPGFRVLFHCDLGSSLDDPAVDRFLTRLAAHADVVAFDPRGQGASPGCFGPGMAEDLRQIVEHVDRWWKDGLPLVLVGHGLGGAIVLAAADHGSVAAVVALAPWLLPLEPPAATLELLAGRTGGAPSADEVRSLLTPLEVPQRAGRLRVPMLLVDAREDPLRDPASIAGIAAAHAGGSLLTAPGDSRAALGPPWPELIVAWATASLGLG